MLVDYQNKMMEIVERKEVPDHVTVVDGILGGCGLGPKGDPNTFLPELWRAVIEEHGITSVLDVGCGFGYSTEWFEGQNLYTVGLEGSRAIADHARTRAVRRHNFEDGKPRNLPEFDLAWSSEFLEHVSAEHEVAYFAAFVRCRYALVTAALPGFGGHHHVNEQPSEYWIERFGKYGFTFLEDETNRYRKLAHETNASCYFQACGLFFRRARVVELPALWTDLDGPLDRPHGDLLQTIAKNRTVLDLGSDIGRTMTCLAERAKQVTVATTEPANGQLTDLAAAHGLTSKVEPVGLDDASRDEIRKRRFGMVVVDAHEDTTHADTYLGMECLLPGGFMVWRNFNRPGVREEIAKTGLPVESIKNFDHLGVLETAKHQVAVVMPHSRGAEMRAVKAGIRGCVGRVANQIAFADFSFGCLCHNFNTLLAHSLCARDNGRCTHMAMLHSDVYADPGWVDLLSEEMCKSRAVVVSAVVAIKDPDDDRTSTAVGLKDNPWDLARFIRLRDHATMPTTFTGEDVCQNDNEELLINTGCMLIDLCHEFWDSFCFEVHNRIVKFPDGSRQPQFRPEDWEMSRALNRAGLKYAATWVVEARHIGELDWPNRPRTQVLSHG